MKKSSSVLDRLTATLTLNGTSRFANGIFLDGGTTNLGAGSELKNGGIVYFYVGYSGTGVLNLSDGGKATATNYIYLGRETGSSGTVTISGTGSELNGGTYLYVGHSGTGVLNLTDGGKATAANYIYLGFNAGSSGTVTVSGTGSELNCGGNYFRVGRSGTGVLNLLGGGKATAANNIYLGTLFGSSGTVTVGSGSTLRSTSGNIYVGGTTTTAQGKGLLAGSGTVSAGGADGVRVWSTGTLAPGDTPGNEPGTVSPVIGTLNITGNLELQAASTLKLDIGDTDNDKIAVSGAVTVGSNLNLNVAASKTGTFDIITAGSAIDGTNLASAIISATGTVDGYSLVARSGTNSVQLKSGNDRIIELTLDALQKATLYWTGDTNGTWSTSATDLNWTDDPTGVNVQETRFMNGDDVVFDNSATDKNVTVASGGVSVGTMDVTSDGYIFNLTAGTSPAISATGNIALNNSTLNITGYTPGTDVGSNVQTVITSDTGISGFNSAVKVMDQATSDFLSASAYQEGNTVKVETRLSWYSTDPDRKAHGDFTVDSGTFTLGAILNDNSASTNRRSDWDGKSLTKLGSGTLILTGANTTDGPTIVSDGTLALSGGGSIASSESLTLADGTTFDISGITATRTDVKAVVADGATLNLGAAKQLSATDFTMTGTNTVNLDTNTAGTYTLLSSTNAVSAWNSNVMNAQTGLRDSVRETETTLEYQILAAGPATLFWNGNSSDWNATDKSFRSSEGFNHAFQDKDNVTFADGPTNKNVNVTSAIEVGTMAVTGTGYTFNVDLDNDGSIIATEFSNTGNAAVVATKNDASGLGRGESNKTLFTVLSGAGANLFDLTFDTTNTRIGYEAHVADGLLGFYLWHAMLYADEYGSRLSPNGNRMAGLIDNLSPGNALLDRLDALTDDTLVLSGIENATGEAYAASMDGTARLQRTFNDLVIARKTFRGSCDPCSPASDHRERFFSPSGSSKNLNGRLWGRFTGGSHDRSNIGRYSGYDLSNYGVAFGMERKISSRWFGGIAFGYDNANLKLDERHAKDEFEAFRASLYGGFAGRNGYASGYAGYSKSWHDMDRNNYALGFSNRGKYDDDVFSTGLELGRVLKLRGGARLIPSVGIHWIHLDSPAFTERGDLASALFVSKSHYDSVRLPIGARLNRTFMNRSISWTPEVRAFYVAELADTRAGLNTAFASAPGSGTAFADSGDGGRSGGMFGTGVTAQLTTRLSVGIDYDYEVWEHYDRHNLTGNVTVRW